MKFKSLSAENVILLPTPYPLQVEILNSPARYKIVATGRRVGKTTTGKLYTSETVLTYPNVTTWWVAPTNTATNLAWNGFKTIFGGIAEISETYKWMRLPNRSTIWCKSAELPDNLRGEGVDLIVIDEAAHVRKLDYVWAGVLRPMLIDSGGSMLALSSPNRRNQFYTWYQRGLDPLNDEWETWSAPTFANPYLPPDELAKLETEYPPGSELYRQEILGEFLEGSGVVFRKIRDAAIASRNAQPDTRRVYYAGVDWGQSKDFTVLIILDDSGQVVFIDRFNAADYVVQRDRIRAACERWHVKQVVVETNAMGVPNCEMLERDGLPVVRFTTTAQSKRPLIEGLAQAFELGTILPDAVLMSELESYERKVSPTTGVSTYSAPDGMHDDCVMALALAYHAIHAPQWRIASW